MLERIQNNVKLHLLNKDQDKNFVRLLGMVLFIVIFMTIFTNGKFLSTRNISSMLILMPELGILSLGIMLAMIVGGIDLSIVAIANLSAIVGAKVMLALEGGWYGVFVGIIATLLVGIACGVLNGFFIARIGVHPILITLGTYQLYQGVAIVVSKGYAIVNFSEGLTLFMNGGLFLIFPNIFLIFAVLIFLLSFMLNRTIFGQSIYLIGSNYKASIFSALKSAKAVHIVYVLVGILAAIAGLIMSGKTNSAKADYGASYTLQTILICLLGGINWSGGVGKTSGVLVALVALQSINSGFSLMRYSNFFLFFTSGVFLLLVLLFHFYMDKHNLKKLV